MPRVNAGNAVIPPRGVDLLVAALGRQRGVSRRHLDDVERVPAQAPVGFEGECLPEVVDIGGVIGDRVGDDRAIHILGGSPETGVAPVGSPSGGAVVDEVGLVRPGLGDDRRLHVGAERRIVDGLRCDQVARRSPELIPAGIDQLRRAGGTDALGVDDILVRGVAGDVVEKRCGHHLEVAAPECAVVEFGAEALVEHRVGKTVCVIKSGDGLVPVRFHQAGQAGHPEGVGQHRGIGGVGPCGDGRRPGLEQLVGAVGVGQPVGVAVAVA